jgi:hypothetical protein
MTCKAQSHLNEVVQIDRVRRPIHAGRIDLNVAALGADLEVRVAPALETVAGSDIQHTTAAKSREQTAGWDKGREGIPRQQVGNRYYISNEAKEAARQPGNRNQSRDSSTMKQFKHSSETHAAQTRTARPISGRSTLRRRRRLRRVAPAICAHHGLRPCLMRGATPFCR